MSRAVPCLVGASLVLTLAGCGMPSWPGGEAELAAGVEPGFVVKDPYSYSQTFLIPAVEESAVAITLHIDYELLRQATPTSEEYVQQTGTDTLTIALASD